MADAWDYVVIVDLEATCDFGPQRRVTRATHEIIEFPFLVYCVQSGRVVLAEQHYVHPTTLDDVTEFCTKLTGIQRATLVERGETLQAVATRLEHVCKTLPRQRSVTLLCDGRWDVHFMLQKELRAKGVQLDTVSSAIAPTRSARMTWFLPPCSLRCGDSTTTSRWSLRAPFQLSGSPRRRTTPRRRCGTWRALWARPSWARTTVAWTTARPFWASC